MDATDTQMVEQVAKAMAFSVRQPNDASGDADEYWAHTGSVGQYTWTVAARAAISAMPDTTAINALLIEVSEVAEDAYGYDHIYETTFHGHVYEKLSDALKSYRASMGMDK